VFIAASTRTFASDPIESALAQITELEFDKVELWMNDESNHLRPSDAVRDADGFFARYREATRLSPIAFCLEHDVPADVFLPLCKLAKLMRVTQCTIPASPLGTPFNSEIDRLRERVKIASAEGVRVSIKSRTGELSEDPHTAVELCQAVPGLGITLDPSYYICGPNRGKTYDQVFPYVFHTHLRDTTPEQLQVQIGLGEIDYSRLISQLRRQNYNRALSVEVLPELSEGLNRHLELRKLRMLLDTLL
jgi:sugar phosphate isomerase/epimerase